MSEVKVKATDLVSRWERAKSALDAAKKLERELREEIVAEHFQQNSTGTHHFDTPDGRDLVCVKKLNYRMDKATTAQAQTEIAAIIGNELAGRLVNWKPDLSLKEYGQLPDAARTIIDRALTITPATPTLELRAKK
jgi:hypothetical protein